MHPEGCCCPPPHLPAIHAMITGLHCNNGVGEGLPASVPPEAESGPGARCAGEHGLCGPPPPSLICGLARPVSHHCGYLHPWEGVQISAILTAAPQATSAVTPIPRGLAWAGTSISVDRNPRIPGVCFHRSGPRPTPPAPGPPGLMGCPP